MPDRGPRQVLQIWRQGVALGALLLLAACLAPTPGANSRPTTLTVYAAASLKDVFEAVVADFEAEHLGTEVLLNLGGSQQLAQQLAEGAPGDLFASANQFQMQAVIDAGRVKSDTPRVFARNKLVVVYPPDNPAGLATFADLAQPGIKLVIAAASVPAGEYTLQFLDKAAASPGSAPGYQEAVLANVVSYEENVRSVLNKVALGEADAGVVYSSDVTPDQRDAVGQLEIPIELNVVAEYPVAVLTDSAQRALAQQFMNYLLTEPAQRRMIEFGFVPLEPNK